MERAAPERSLRARRETGYETSRPDVRALVPRSARRVLDIGCASGALGGALKESQPVEVIGIEVDEEYATDARERLDSVICGDVDRVLAERDLGRFDCVVAADVLEHLVDPWGALRAAAALLVPGGAAVVSLPNIRYWQALARIAFGGTWPREDAGIFDRTHLRWFTTRDAHSLLEQAGLRVDAASPQYWDRFGRSPTFRRMLPRRLWAFLPGQYVVRGVRNP
jgi:methionine biosynthesis protein MetW